MIRLLSHLRATAYEHSAQRRFVRDWNRAVSRAGSDSHLDEINAIFAAAAARMDQVLPVERAGRDSADRGSPPVAPTPAPAAAISCRALPERLDPPLGTSAKPAVPEP